jgi:hypothetical protein
MPKSRLTTANHPGFFESGEQCVFDFRAFSTQRHWLFTLINQSGLGK